MHDLEKYNEIFCEVLDVGKEELNVKLEFNSIESWDSLAHIILISKLEDSFGVLFETEDILNFGSYENGKRILKKYGITVEG